MSDTWGLWGLDVREAKAPDDNLVLYHGTLGDRVEGIKAMGLTAPPSVNAASWPMLTTSFDQAANYVGGRPNGVVMEYHVPRSRMWENRHHSDEEPVLWPGDSHTAYGSSDAVAYGVRGPLGAEYLRNVHRLPGDHTARVEIPYIRNNGGVRQWAGPDDFGQQVEPWGRYMSDGTDTGQRPLNPGWERGNVTFENPIHMPHDYGDWKQNLSQAHGGLTGQALSDALLAKGHDGIVTHDKYGIGEIVDLRPKDQRGHQVTHVARTASTEFPEFGHQLPNAPGPHPDDFWGGGGCAHMALAFKSMWPDLKIGADIDNRDGTVNHAWVHDGKRSHDFMGTHDTPDAPAGMFPNATTHMDMDPAHLASIFGRNGIRWSPDDPWNDGTVHEAAGEIEKHWLGHKPYDPDNDDDQITVPYDPNL